LQRNSHFGARLNVHCDRTNNSFLKSALFDGHIISADFQWAGYEFTLLISATGKRSTAICVRDRNLSSGNNGATRILHEAGNCASILLRERRTTHHHEHRKQGNYNLPGGSDYREWSSVQFREFPHESSCDQARIPDPSINADAGTR
jgi:hypothetical protein